jgi:flagellar biosynthesis protein FlhF
MHVFVGPMGSGKTSHLVKTAAQLVIRDKKRIAIVSTDTTKVGAVDQLKIYCQILNVPFAVIRDKSEWAWLESQLQNVDHILVDSPGMSLLDMDEIQRIRSLMPPNSEAAQVHLCLSSAMKESDALEAVRRYRIVQPTDLVFTALDLSVQHGVIATVQLRSGLPLHSFGTGPRVPEDFELATKERVLDLLFKLSSLKRTTEK